MIYTTHFKNYKKYECLFPEWPTERLDSWDNGVNLHGGNIEFFDNSMPIIQQLGNELKEVCNNYFTENSIPLKFLELYEAWMIQYEVGSYHEPHIHGTKYTVIVSFDNIDSETLFIVLPSGQELQFKDVAGELKIFQSGELWHGVYPVPDRRRVLVLEYVYTSA